MTNKIATLPAWIVFVTLIIPIIATNSLPYGVIVPLVFYFIWIYSLGVEAHHALPQGTSMSIKKLKFALVYSTGYGIVASFYFSSIAPYAAPFHIFAMFCIFYSFYFVAKEIRSIELGRTAKFEDWFAVFFGMWFFPIGVWFVQPKIKRIVVSQRSSNQEDAPG